MRYHGGKWRLAPWIIGHFPPHRVYSECFGGAASVLMRKPRCYSEVYNDLSEDVWNVFRVLREARQDLEEALRATPFSRTEYELAKGPVADDPIERARRTILRSHQGFGSASYLRTHSTGFRASALRSGTTPAQDWKTFPQYLEAFQERLRGVTLENREAEAVLRATDSARTLHYLDPPYVASTRSTHEDTYEHEMSAGDYAGLAEVLCELEGMVVLSGYDCDLMQELFSSWKQVRRQAVASSQNASTTRTECLWFNDAAASEQRQQSLFD
jgi:DNA adenine methylase